MTRRPLEELENAREFIHRHIGPSEDDIAAMLGELGLASLDELAEKTVPQSIRESGSSGLAPARSEADVLAELARVAARNKVMTTMIGMGYYDTLTPPVILRNILENPGWYTAYTPYQPEISQGRLEALLNFQTMVMDLTGMEMANASMLDEATAAAEAMTLARNVAKSESKAFFVAQGCHPQTLGVVRTRAEPLDIEVIVGDPSELSRHRVFGALLQYPDTHGEIADPRAAIAAAHEQGAIAIVATDLLALVMLTPPGALGADVVIGSSQRFGVPLGFGGPHAAFMAARDAYKRAVPGRLVGVSVDAKGRMAMRLALQTREQHIRREKATSNICTAQVLLAVIAGMYAVYHGPQGLKTIAGRVHRLTAILAEGLRRLGYRVANRYFFDTVVIETPGKAKAMLEGARKAGINLRDLGPDRVGISADEATTRGHIEALWDVFAGGPSRLSMLELDAKAPEGLPEDFARKQAFLAHPVFNRHHCETDMLRYMHRLEEKDVALNRSMIPLGSCTMKLNATAEMIPVTWRSMGGIHPFAPLDQAKGYLQMIKDLEKMLQKATGFAAVSLQPNAGSQGEYAGLLVIRKYHRSRGEAHRNVCLIPSSAHGTNPASAAMCGMSVVVVACDGDGNVDVADLKTKAAAHKADLAALMVTYPSTHGVFEERIREICRVVHENGGQVYMDGANMNAQVGLCRPGKYGPDVMHLNLHKTFCIPHGGGGPGVGPIAVGKHLVAFLPSHPVHPECGGKDGIGPVSAAPWGSASILPISWSYIAMMGEEGLKKATQVAILSANYMAKKLGPHFPVLYTGRAGFVAHECILDLRPLKDASGIAVDDVAKRLMDYGFHAPTMSFPVAGTLMVEPTESEPKAELDRFIEAMISIRGEIKRVETGVYDKTDNPLKNAPHTAEDVTGEDWAHKYSRADAAFPVDALRGAKYWPPVNRIDQVYGDRHFICACPPIESYKNAAE